MILTLDVGNSNITLGAFEEDKLYFVARFSTDSAKTEDEFAIKFLQLLSLHNTERASISGIIVASVVPPLNDSIKKAVRTVFGTDALFVGPGIKSGIGILCDMPSSVGADIIAASVAVHNIYGSPSLIIDMGTATKMTVLNHKGAFIGTSIIPGVIMGLSALSERTAQLPRISLELPHSIIAKNTADCMRSGVLYGNAAMVDGMIDRINEEFGEKLTVYATGGMASTVIPLCRHNIITDEHLVLRGLNILYRKNRPAT